MAITQALRVQEPDETMGMPTAKKKEIRAMAVARIPY
jgi:hypothetical protein